MVIEDRGQVPKYLFLKADRKRKMLAHFPRRLKTSEVTFRQRLRNDDDVHEELPNIRSAET